MFDRFSENSRRVMQTAYAAARRHAAEAIDVEHLLLGLLGTECHARAMLLDLGVDVRSLHDALDTMLPRGESTSMGQLPFTPASKRALEETLAAAQQRGDTHIGSQHLLLGIVAAGDNDAATLLGKVSVDRSAIERAMNAIPMSDRSRQRLLLISNSTMHGGGYLEHCAAEIDDFLADRKRVMFVPFALADHDGYASKARQAFVAKGRELLSVHTYDDKPRALDEADAVFVGGGNTFRLLKALDHYGLIEGIRRKAQAGMPYIGSSAGTNVATQSIRTTNDMPIVQPRSFDALQLVPFQINPHYLDPDPGSSHMGETREERIAQFHEEHGTPVLGLREGCMLRVEGAKMELRGSTDARLFRRGQEPTEHSPPCDLSFLLED